MCKSRTEPGGPRRCSGDARATYENASAAVKALEDAVQDLLDKLERSSAHDEGNIDEQSKPYLEGQEDARSLFNVGRTPDWILIEQLDPNRAAGMRAEWAELTGYGNITPGSHQVDIRTGRALGLHQ